MKVISAFTPESSTNRGGIMKGNALSAEYKSVLSYEY